MKTRIRAFGIPLTTVVLVVAIWELIGALSGVSPTVLPRPSKIVSVIGSEQNVFLSESMATLTASLIGFVVAVVLGFVLAVVMVGFKAIEQAVYPLIVVTQVTPTVAIAPLLVIYFGFGRGPKIFLAALIAFFPIVINTAAGLRRVEKVVVELMQTYNATKLEIFRKVRIPNCLPDLMEAMKISVAFAVVGTVVSEFTSGSSGLGYLVLSSMTRMNTARAFAALFMLVIIGVVLFYVVQTLAWLAVPWARRKQS